MKAYEFVTVDVFTDLRFGGNPLAVFPDARGLSDSDMQSLAAEFNLSETTFVLPPDDPANTARVRIFNRTAEMPFAGHPNVGTGWVLAGRGRARDGGVTIAAPQPLSLGPEMPADLLAGCVGIAPAEIVSTAHRPVMASVGNSFVVAEVTPEALTRAAPDLAHFRDALAAFPALGPRRLPLYLYAHTGPKRDRIGLRARMFSPLSGTIEDAATGSAATPLAAILLSLTTDSEQRYSIVQGVEMGRPSLLLASAHRAEDGIRAAVGGNCVPMLRGEVSL